MLMKAQHTVSLSECDQATVLIPAVSMGMGHMDGPLMEHAGVKKLHIKSIKIHLKTLKPFFSLVSHLTIIGKREV